MTRLQSHSSQNANYEWSEEIKMYSKRVMHTQASGLHIEAKFLIEALHLIRSSYAEDALRPNPIFI